MARSPASSPVAGGVRSCSRKAGERGVEPGGQLDIQQLFAAAAQMQSQLISAQQQLADTEVDGTAGGGLVTVTVNGQGELVDVVIAPAAIDAGDPEETAQTLADLVLAACRAAYGAIADLQEEMMGPLASGLGGDAAGLPGMPGIPGLPGLLGQPDPGRPASGAGPDRPSGPTGSSGPSGSASSPGPDGIAELPGRDGR